MRGSRLKHLPAWEILEYDYRQLVFGGRLNTV